MENNLDAYTFEQTKRAGQKTYSLKELEAGVGFELLQTYQKGKEGAEGAFTTLINSLYNRLLTYVGCKLRDLSDCCDAEQIVIDTLTRISANPLKNNKSFTGYLYTSINNTIHNALKHRANSEPNLIPSDESYDKLDEPYDKTINCSDNNTPDSELETELAMETINEAIKRASKVKGDGIIREQVLRLYYLGGYEQHEIAELLNIPIGTVQSNLDRGTKKLRKALLK